MKLNNHWFELIIKFCSNAVCIDAFIMNLMRIAIAAKQLKIIRFFPNTHFNYIKTEHQCNSPCASNPMGQKEQKSFVSYNGENLLKFCMIWCNPCCIDKTLWIQLSCVPNVHQCKSKVASITQILRELVHVVMYNVHIILHTF